MAMVYRVRSKSCGVTVDMAGSGWVSEYRLVAAGAANLTTTHEKTLNAWRAGFFHGKTNRRGAYSDLSIIQYG